MDLKKIEKLQIAFEGDEISRFKNIVKKIEESESKVGFSNSTLDINELKLLKDLKEKLA